MAVAGINPPKSMDFSNARSTWSAWKQRFERYRTASGLSNKTPEQQVDILIYVMGEEAESIHNQLTIRDQTVEDGTPVATDTIYARTLEAFNGYFNPQENTLHYRILFSSRLQASKETNEQFIREIYELAAKCSWTDTAVKQDMIKTRLLAGMLDKTLSRELQLKPDISLEDIKLAMRSKEVILQNQKCEIDGAAAAVAELSVCQLSVGNKSSRARNPMGQGSQQVEEDRNFRTSNRSYRSQSSNKAAKFSFITDCVREKLKRELDSLEKTGIICKDNEPAEWLSPIVVVNKPNGAIRICLNPQHLNSQLVRSHCMLPTTEEIFSCIAGSCCFSTLDAKQGFHQVPLDDKSSKLVGFLTPYGKYRYLRLPMGLSVAPELFHQLMVDALTDIPGVEVFIDDVLIHGKSLSQHNDRLEQVLAKLKQVGITLNKDKCVVGREQVDFLGHHLTAHGIQPQQGKLEAIEHMMIPQNKKELESYLGFVAYLAKFVQNLSELTVPLRQKDLGNMTPRLAKMRLELLEYPIDMHLTFRPGKEMVLADTLSRSCPSESTEDVEVDVDPMLQVCSIVIRSDEVMVKYQKATEEDEELSMVMKYVRTGWPTNRKSCAGRALAYWNIKDSLTVYEGLVFYGSRLVIPNMLRQEVLRDLHGSSGSE
ncbi:hypothetical protein EB796_003223 [Bugula neritina]|uniref:Reverse transcriptase domain-containing protein n=1 Tax=Bugula neritina TaxID=10212 RepID=A0A7J7KL67_BUGNE|nr:hypothetical protein EB796_003223 [Bugula neritina]